MTQDYAYEIRFVDDNKVQVFDLARRHLDPTSATLPTEYKTEEVLRGDLRYSKLLGTQQPVTEEQWEHVTYTKRGRRSIQRHTFMMGGSSIEHDTVMDLEVGNRDMADIRFNQNNVYQSNNRITTATTNENTASIQNQSSLFGSTEPIANSPDYNQSSLFGSTEPIANSPDYNQSKHYEFVEEVDMANLTKTPSIRVNDDDDFNNHTNNEENKKEKEKSESAAQSISSLSLYGRTRDSQFDNKKQNDSDTESSQQQSEELNETGFNSHYSLDNQLDQAESDNRYDHLEVRKGLNDHGKNDTDPQFIMENLDIQHNSLKQQDVYNEKFVSKSQRELDNSINPVQNQQVYYRDDDNMNQDATYYDVQLNHQHQMIQEQSSFGSTPNNDISSSHYSQSTRNVFSSSTSTITTPVITTITATSATATTSNYDPINIPTTGAVSNNEANLTRVKSVPLENYDASPERSCCIIS